MANLSQLGSFQTYNSNSSTIRPPSTKFKIIDETSGYARMPYSSMRTRHGTNESMPSSSDGRLRPMSMSAKRRSSAVILNNLLSRRKSLQTTALATRRQSLWMSIAKNDSVSNECQTTPLPLVQENNNLMRKKILRLLLVFSYLISISLLAVALATFYGFFWSGYSKPQTTTTTTTSISDVTTTVRSLVSLASTSTLVDNEAEIEHNVLMTSAS